MRIDDIFRILLEAEEEVPPPPEESATPEVPTDDVGGDVSTEPTPDFGGDVGVDVGGDAGGGGSILGSGGGGGGGGDGGGISGAGGGADAPEGEATDPVETLQQATEDPINFISNSLVSKSLEVADSSELLSDAKGLIQALALTADQVQQLIDQIREANPNYVLLTALVRLEQFILPAKVQENKMTQEEKIKHLVKEYVEVFLKKKGKSLLEEVAGEGEDKTLEAMRLLDLEVQKMAISFEDKMRSQLGLMHYAKMDKQSQMEYLSAVHEYKLKFVASVVDCVNRIAKLPKASKDGEEVKPAVQAIPETPQMPHQPQKP